MRKFQVAENQKSDVGMSYCNVSIVLKGVFEFNCRNVL